jgi:dTDP-4-amino-4,6-dideoxygalactose transaminase
MAALPSIWLDFVDQAIESVPVNIGVRRGNALIYHRTLSNPSTLIDEKLINTGACLRYPLLVSNRNQVIRALKKHHVHISDTWYKAVVDCGSGPNISTYRSGCPNAQYLAEHIINLPTHQYVTPEIAKTIAVLINQLTN